MANNTEIYIFKGIKTPRGGLDTINFDTVEQQSDYYINHPSKVWHTTESKPIHEDSKLTVNGLFTTFEQANYLMYKFNNKWYYGFINSVHQDNYDDISNSGNITIEYELDYFQTYLFQIKELKHTFTVRRHLKNDKASISPRIYDEMNPIYKNIVENKKVGFVEPTKEMVIKWVVVVTKRKQTGTVTGDINPFSMCGFPVVVYKNGFDPVCPSFVINGKSSPMVQPVYDAINTLMGNTKTPNQFTSQVVNIYVLSDIPFNWKWNGSAVTIDDTSVLLQNEGDTGYIEFLSVDNTQRIKTISIDRIDDTLWEHLKKEGVTEYQMLNSTLCGASIANEYGIMDLEMKFLAFMKEHKLDVATNITDKGDIITTIHNYMGNSVIAMQRGIKGSGKPQTILSNASATYMQANKNAFENQKQQLDLRAEQLQASQTLQSGNLEKTQEFGNRQNNINYGTAGEIAFRSSQVGMGLGAVSGLVGSGAGLVGSAMSGNVMGVVSNGLGLIGGANNAVGTGAQIYNNFQQRDLNQDKDNYALEYQRQSVNLAQRQAQQNMNMARKSFESANADRLLQPLTINQLGLSTAMDYLNDLFTHNIVYWQADKYSLTMANNELRRDGTFVADYYDFSEMMTTRKKFNKIQIADTIELSLNQARREMINGALNTGVRFWNYSGYANRDEFENAYMNDYNPD